MKESFHIVYRTAGELSEKIFSLRERIAFIYTFPLPFRKGSHSANRPYPRLEPRKILKRWGVPAMRGQTLPPRLKTYPRIDSQSKFPQTVAPPRIAGRCDPSGGAARPPLFIPHLFLLQNSAHRPAFCRSVALLKFAHTRVKRRLLRHLVQGCHSAPGNGTQGFTGAIRRCCFPLPYLCFLFPNS